MDGIGEDDITTLDDFQCYVKLSLDGHGLPVFSLALDAPPWPDEQGEQFVRLHSRGRYARTAAQTRSRAPTRSVGEDAEEERDHAGAEAGSMRRHKKRGSGSGGQRTQEEQQETPDA